MIERRRTSVVCVHRARVLCIELEDPTTRKRMWSLPGGAIEPDETREAAAVRETLEETGYTVDLLLPGETTRYRFRWNAKVFDCECAWFPATLANDDAATVDDAAYLLGHRWLTPGDIAMLFSYHPHIRDVTLRLAARAGAGA